MVEVNSFVNAKALDNNAGKLENKDKLESKEQAANIAVDSWKDLEKLSPKVPNMKGKEGDDKVLTFNDIYNAKKELASNFHSTEPVGKKYVPEVKPGAITEGGLTFSPDKGKTPADGGIKDNTGNIKPEGGKLDSIKGGQALDDGGIKDDFTKDKYVKKPVDGGLKDPDKHSNQSMDNSKPRFQKDDEPKDLTKDELRRIKKEKGDKTGNSQDLDIWYKSQS